VEVKTRVAIMQAISRLGAFIPAEVPPEVRHVDKLKVLAEEVRQVMYDLIADGTLQMREAGAGPKQFWRVEKPKDLLDKIDYASIQ